MTTWALWRQPRPLLVFVLVVEIVAATLTVILIARAHATGHDGLVFAALAISGVAQAEIGRHVERQRRRLTDTPYINLTSVWTFAGVLVLPAALVAALIAVLYLHLDLRTARTRVVPAWRTVMNAAFVVITCFAARAVVAGLDLDGHHDLTTRPWSGTAVIAAGLAVYFVVGALLVIPSIWARTHSLAAVVGTRADNALELATLCFGAVLAAGVTDVPALAVVVVPPLAVLHRGLLNQDVERSATRDHKTGLLNAASWRWAATQELADPAPGTSIGVLMVDLDWFKSVNDKHGHLNGDRVLLAVATCLREQVRRHDIVGRFGGEEFAVLLPDSTDHEVGQVAERMRSAVESLQVRVLHPTGNTTIEDLSISIGQADYPRHGASLDQVLDAADTALYRAKRAGRNQVVRAAGKPTPIRPPDLNHVADPPRVV